eukprot:TRINITY_DN6077_c0_g1_i1.p1 TRINITY_DN6077_c0_g1~~TRINITY_DN6077_c0_g1_i1.p1  ORF type:complete len:377 (+),score=100.19 TRINITY_DN6077_c0_g1_i1:52-1182(+)
MEPHESFCSPKKPIVITTTRSGRTSFPPLHYWSNQTPPPKFHPRIPNPIHKRPTKKIKKLASRSPLKVKNSNTITDSPKPTKESKEKYKINPVEQIKKLLKKSEQTPPSLTKKRSLATSRKEDESKEEWTEEEEARLTDAITAVPVWQLNYWQEISNIVLTKTPLQCHEKYQSRHKKRSRKKTTVGRLDKNPNKKKKKKEDGDKGEEKKERVLTGGKNTIKRKRQLREMINEHCAALPKTEDPLFDRSATSSAAFAKSMRDLDTDFDLKNDGIVWRSSVSNPQSPGMASEEALPDEILKPVDRDCLDGYIINLKKKTRAKNWSASGLQKSQTTATRNRKVEKNLEGEDTKKEVLNILEQKEESSDEEENSDYYFSD